MNTLYTFGHRQFCVCWIALHPDIKKAGKWLDLQLFDSKLEAYILCSLSSIHVMTSNSFVDCGHCTYLY
jgi:hypothetical protein